MEAKSSKDTIGHDDSNSKSVPGNLKTLTLTVPECDGAAQLEKMISKQLNKLTTSLSSKDREATLSTLKRIFDNIIQHPSDEKYRQIKLTSKTFTSKVWQYPAGEELMKMNGWVVEDDYVRLRDESHAKAVSKLLEQEFKRSAVSADHTHKFSLGKRPRFYGDENVNTATSSSSKCCELSDDTAANIVIAIQIGEGLRLKELLSPYHATCVKFMKVAGPLSIIEFVCYSRQIGIARILASEYGVDFSSIHEKFLVIFDGCNDNESCQSLIIEFIKEFKIDVNRQYHLTALHLAVLNKLFTVVKFLVEDCKVDVNFVSSSIDSGTPLHMAYGIGEENIAQLLIEHGAGQDAIDANGRKPKDYKICTNYANNYALMSQMCVKRRLILNNYLSRECNYFRGLCQDGRGIAEVLAIELTFKEFPSLQEVLDGGIANHRNLEATPIMNKLNRFLTDMAPSYYDIGLELDIVNSQLKLIKNDIKLPDLKERCRKMLEVWLENDTSATWKKLCDALQEVGMSVLAEQIKNSL